jgi:hypothetical protein
MRRLPAGLLRLRRPPSTRVADIRQDRRFSEIGMRTTELFQTSLKCPFPNIFKLTGPPIVRKLEATTASW